MTEGSPAKLLITFALPLMVGNVFQQLYTVVDTAVYSCWNTLPTIRGRANISKSRVGCPWVMLWILCCAITILLVFPVFSSPAAGLWA